MKKSNIAIALLTLALLFAGLTACTAQKESTEENLEPVMTPIETSGEVYENEVTAHPLDNESTILYQNLDIGFTLEFPSSWEGKFIIKEYEIDWLGRNSIELYHKATMDEREDIGWLGSFGRTSGFYTADWPPVMAGWCPILEYKNGFTYYYQSPSDVQYSEDETGQPITDAAREYVEMREQLKEIMNSMIVLDTWITPDDSIDMSGMNLCWQEGITYFAKDEKAKISLYASAEMDGKQDWLLLMETVLGTYPLFPRTTLEMGKISCEVFNLFDKDVYGATTVLVTVEKSDRHIVYEYIFNDENDAFKVASVYNKYIEHFTQSPN